MQLTWELCDLEQTVLATLDDRMAGATVDIGRHTARLASIDLAGSDPAFDLVSTGDTVLRCTVDGWTDPLFVGRVNTREISADGEDAAVTVSAADPLNHLAQKIIRVYETAGATPDAYIWETYGASVQPATLISDLISDHAADAGIAIGTTPGGATALTMSFPLGMSVLDAILSITGLDDAVEFELTPTEAVDGTLVTFNAYYPRQGSDLTATVEIQIGVDANDNATEFSYAESQVDIINRHIAISDVVGTGLAGSTEFPLRLVRIASHAASITQYGAFESVSSLSGVTDTTVLTNYAKAIVAANAYPTTDFSAVLDPTSSLDFSPDGDFWVGDTISLTAALPEETLSLEGRVAAATFTEQENGEVEVALAFEPEADVAGVSGTTYYGMVDPADGTAPTPPESPEPSGVDSSTPTSPKPKKDPGKGRKWVWSPGQGWVRIRKKNKHKQTGL